MTFDQFLTAQFAGLSRYATVLAGDRDRAQDVLQDALIKVQARWRKISRMRYPTAYVRRVVTTTFISDTRRWSVRHIRPTAPGHLPDTTTPDPSEAVDDRAELTGLLATLGPQQRAAL